MKTKIIIFTSLVVISCSSTKNITDKDIVGEYEFRASDDIYGVRARMEFNVDHTFNYMRNMGSYDVVVWEQSCGLWQRDKNKIILNSELQPFPDSIPNYEIIRTENNSSDSLIIKVFTPDNEPLPFFNCKLKLDTAVIASTSANFDGEATLKKILADSLIISYPCDGGYIRRFRHQFKEELNYYEFKITKKGYLFRIYFTNETWFYKNDRLYDPVLKNENNKIYYRKIK